MIQREIYNHKRSTKELRDNMRLVCSVRLRSRNLQAFLNSSLQGFKKICLLKSISMHTCLSLNLIINRIRSLKAKTCLTNSIHTCRKSMYKKLQLICTSQNSCIKLLEDSLLVRVLLQLKIQRIITKDSQTSLKKLYWSPKIGRRDSHFLLRPIFKRTSSRDTT